MLHPDASHLLADPINGIYITPMSDEWDDHCLNCAQPIRLAPLPKVEDRYWFHAHSLANNCLRRDLQ